MKSCLIISYPKSGSTWLSYIVEYITKIEVLKLVNNNPNKTKGQGFNMHFDNIGFKYKEGNIKMFREFANIKYNLNFKEILNKYGNPDIIICLIRNPIVCSLRNRNDKWWTFMFKKKKNGKPGSIDDFTFAGIERLIDFYDFFSGEKIMIKYEDMIYNIQNTLFLLSEILSVDGYTEFLDNINIHKERCVTNYRKHFAQKSFSKENPYNILQLEDLNLVKMKEKLKKYKNVYKIWRKYYENDPTDQTLVW